MSLLCRLGSHRWEWPPHESPWQLFQKIRIECLRGCGRRRVVTCREDDHWTDRHPEPAR